MNYEQVKIASFQLGFNAALRTLVREEMEKQAAWGGLIKGFGRVAESLGKRFPRLLGGGVEAGEHLVAPAATNLASATGRTGTRELGRVAEQFGSDQVVKPLEQELSRNAIRINRARVAQAQEAEAIARKAGGPGSQNTQQVVEAQRAAIPGRGGFGTYLDRAVTPSVTTPAKYQVKINLPPRPTSPPAAAAPTAAEAATPATSPNRFTEGGGFAGGGLNGGAAGWLGNTFLGKAWNHPSMTPNRQLAAAGTGAYLIDRNANRRGENRMAETINEKDYFPKLLAALTNQQVPTRSMLNPVGWLPGT